MSSKVNPETKRIAEMLLSGEVLNNSDVDLLYEVYLDQQNQINLNSPRVPKEYELNYFGKLRKEEILINTPSAPLQLNREFNSNKENLDGWKNKLIFGDNLRVLKSLCNDPEVKGKVKLIYIDPPFATKRDFMKDEEKAYGDKIIGAEFIEFLRKRLILLKELLSEDGSIYVHLDQKKGHYIKVVLDEIFGEGHLVNEIIWHYNRWTAGSSKYQQMHDTIYWYCNNTNNYTYNKQYKEYSESSKLAHEKQGYIQRGKFKSEPNPLGVAADDVWDIQHIAGISKERIDYPTQKPERLLEQIINGSSNPGDLILDAFAGSGTTLAVAEKLGRRWIGIDCGKLAIYTIQSRFLNLKSDIGNKGKPILHKAFNLYNAGHYDFELLNSLDFESYCHFIIQLFQVKEKKHMINGVEIDGFKDRHNVLIWKHKDKLNLSITSQFIESLHKSLKGQGGEIFYVIGPSSSFSFAEDMITLESTSYRFLRVPQSIIENLINNNGKALIQPRKAEDINNIVDAIAFDFIEIPEVTREIEIGESEDNDIFNSGKTFANIKLTKFESKAPTADNANLKSFAMVMVDSNYDGTKFSLTNVFFASDLKGNVFSFEINAKLNRSMLIYVDIYGNEFRETVNVKNSKVIK